jgi:hypothetical protein
MKKNEYTKQVVNEIHSYFENRKMDLIHEFAKYQESTDSNMIVQAANDELERTYVYVMNRISKAIMLGSFIVNETIMDQFKQVYNVRKNYIATYIYPNNPEGRDFASSDIRARISIVDELIVPIATWRTWFEVF